MIRSGTLLDLDMASLARAVGSGWQWWTGELAALLPVWLQPRRTLPPGQHLFWNGALSRADGTAPSAGRASVLIDPALVLLRTIERPALSLGDMRSSVALDLDRLTPFALDTAVADVTILGPGSTPGTLQVRLAALPVSVATAIAEACATAAIVPRAVGIVDADRTALVADFGPALRARGLIPSARGARALWWAVVLALFALDLGVYVDRDIAATEHLQALVEAQSPAASGARRVAAGIQREERQRVQLLRDRAGGDALSMLALTSRVLPAGTRLERFAWDGSQLRLSGDKPAQIDLLGALREAGRFTSIRTTTADVATETADDEPFDLTASIAAAR